MTISYPDTLPPDPAPRSVTLVTTSGSAMTASPWTGAQQVQINQLAMWRFSIELPPMLEAKARAWTAFLTRLQGRYGTFYFGDPLWKQPRGSWKNSTVLVNGGDQTGLILNVDGMAAGTNGLAGDYFQLGSGSASRLHMLTADFVADGSGAAALDIWPRLRVSPTDNDALTLSLPKGIFRLASNDVSRSWEPFRYGMSFDVVEAL